MSKPLSLQSLIEKGFIASSETDAVLKVAKQFSVALTPSLLETLESLPDSQAHAIARQFIPDVAELNILPQERADPIGDSHFSPVKGIVHRYPDRCLLLPLSICPAYCRFCFRREKVGKKNQSLSQAELEKAFEYIQSHSAIWEVILTGGEPLLLKPRRFAQIIAALNSIEHLSVIRIHTRLPVMDPNLITEVLVQALDSPKAVYVAVHVNHASELTAAALAACARLRKAGIPLLSQTVLLKGINDEPQVMAELMRKLVANRIKPYYLHHGDLAQGTSHFRTTIQEGQALMRALRGRYSGLCQPQYVLDIPGGHGKVPIHPSFIQSEDTEQKHTVFDYQGQSHSYIG